MLEKSYFCSIANNPTSTAALTSALWFAWKIVLLQYRKQQVYSKYSHLYVVICLKNRTFAVSQTTAYHPFVSFSRLWFAWKIVLLQYRKQPFLENSARLCVVICLKNRTFAVSQTTSALGLNNKFGLWFAWKIVLLQYRKQHLLNMSRQCACCDLLEKSYFCSIANNVRLAFPTFLAVVICLKNRTFAVSQTTTYHAGRQSCKLWFAWKIVLLQYRKQQLDNF